MNVLNIFVVLSLIFYVQCSPVSKTKLSDLTLGELGKDDKLFFSSGTETFPLPGINVTSNIVDMGSEFVKINHVTAFESGSYPDARAKLLKGGPGYNYVKIELIPGLSQGFNYTVKVNGTELERPEIRNC